MKRYEFEALPHPSMTLKECVKFIEEFPTEFLDAKATLLLHFDGADVVVLKVSQSDIADDKKPF